jgi:tetratricopeptide (TPR) repeat protein
VSIAHEIGVAYDEAWALATLVRLHSQLGDTGGAGARLEQLLQLMAEVELTADCQAAILRARAVYALNIGDDQQALADAERAWQISEQSDIPNYRADAAIILGDARARIHQPDLAAAAYQQAVAWYNKIGNVTLLSEPQAGLAQLALAQGERAWAQTLVETLLPQLAEHPRARVHTPFYAYLVCYRVLEANHDRRSITVLQTAQQRLQECARTIADDALRRSFLENVAAHRAILEAAGTAHTLAPQPS